MSAYPPEVRNIIRNLEKLDPADKEKLISASLTGLGKSANKAGVFSVSGERRILVDSVMDNFLGGGSDDFVGWFVKETLMELPEHRAAKILASMFTAKAQNLSKSEMMALFMERAGIMTTKAAQILSTRPDLVPDEADRKALARLKSGTNLPLDKDYLLGMRKDALGPDAEKLVFKKQLGKASTRGAYLVKSGENGVEVLKAFRSDMIRAVTEDLFTYDRIIGKLEQSAELRDKFGIADPRGEFQQIRLGLLEESDSVQEAANARRLQKRLSRLGDDTVRTTGVTEVSRNLIREELSPGLPVEKAVKQYGLDPQKTAAKIAETVLAQVLRGGRVPVFHADPHSENIFSDAQGNIYFIDRGLVGSLSANTRGVVFDLLRAINGKDAPAAAAAMLRLRIEDGRDTRALMSVLPVKSMELVRANTPPAETVLLLVSEAKKLGMTMPRDIFTMAKTFYTMDGVVRDLGANVDYEGIITREYVRYMAGKPVDWMKSLWAGPAAQALPPPLGVERSAPESEWRGAVNQAAAAYKLSPKARRLISDAFTESALFTAQSKDIITSKRAFDAFSLAYLRLEDSRYENTAGDRAVLLEILKQDPLQDFVRGRCSDPASFLSAVTEPGIFKEVTKRAKQTIDAAFPHK
jgi:predicted unusual protein kinase regulating ubiquinone biosynthesis (AarF/ABC1/UbiB family)